MGVTLLQLILLVTQSLSTNLDGLWDLPAFLLIFSVLLGLIGIYTIGMDLLSIHWPCTIGKVTDYHTKREIGFNSSPGFSYGAGVIREHYQRVYLILSYTIADRHYSKKMKTTYRYTRRGMLNPYGSTKDRTLTQVHQWYPPNTEIPIYFNPNRPKQATLVRGFKWNKLWFPIIALVIYLIGVILILAPTDFLLLLHLVSFLFGFLFLLKLFVNLGKRVLSTKVDVT